MLNVRRAWMFAWVALIASRVQGWAYRRSLHHSRLAADTYYRKVRPTLVAGGHEEIRRECDRVFGRERG